MNVDEFAAIMERNRRRALDELNADLFSDGANMRPRRQPTMRQRIRDYFSVLWMALKGEDPHGWD